MPVYYVNIVVKQYSQAGKIDLCKVVDATNRKYRKPLVEMDSKCILKVTFNKNSYHKNVII